MYPVPSNALMSLSSLLAVSFTALMIGIVPTLAGVYDMLAINRFDLSMFFLGSTLTLVGGLGTWWALDKILPEEPKPPSDGRSQIYC